VLNYPTLSETYKIAAFDAEAALAASGSRRVTPLPGEATSCETQ